MPTDWAIADIHARLDQLERSRAPNFCDAGHATKSQVREPLVRPRVECPEFSQLYGGELSAVLLAESEDPLFHEAGVWMPESNEFLVTSNRLKPGTADTHVRISAVHWPSGRVRQCRELEDVIVMGNGGTTDGKGGAYLLSQGLNVINLTRHQLSFHPLYFHSL